MKKREDIKEFEDIDTYYEISDIVAEVFQDRVEAHKHLVTANKEIERLNNIINELEKENEQLKEGINKTEQYEHLLPMKQYPIERDVFCKIFRKIDSDFYDELCDTTTDSFKVWRYDDEFYILHIDSGTLINWYKHLGRCNTCNKNLSIEEYKKLANDLYNELEGSDEE